MNYSLSINYTDYSALLEVNGLGFSAVFKWRGEGKCFIQKIRKSSFAFADFNHLLKLISAFSSIDSKKREGDFSFHSAETISAVRSSFKS